MMLEWRAEVITFVQLIGGILVAAGVLIMVLRPLRISGYENIVVRYKAWWVMVLIFGGAILAHRAVAFLLITGLGLWAMREYYRLVPEVKEHRRLMLVGYLSVIALMVTAFMDWYGLFQAMPIYCILAALLISVMEGRTEGMTARSGEVVLGIVYFGWMPAHLLFMLNYPAGLEMALYLVLLTELNDVLAFTTGRIFGRHPLAPSISPNKTMEGFIGGALGTLGLAIALRSLAYLSLVHALFLGLIIALFGVVGDLVISVFKRDRHVKDTGFAIPGHGGLLDRIDSLLFVTPLFFHYARYFDLFGFVAECVSR